MPPVMKSIVADGTAAIPILISQLTDSREITPPLYPYWPSTTVGELAYFIFRDLFSDRKRVVTVPELFPRIWECGLPAWQCWAAYRKTHSLNSLQSKFLKFWKANEANVYWDAEVRCFRLSRIRGNRP